MTQKIKVITTRLCKDFLESMGFMVSHEDALEFLKHAAEFMQEFIDHPVYIGELP